MWSLPAGGNRNHTVTFGKKLLDSSGRALTCLVRRPQQGEPGPEAGAVQQQRRAEMSTEAILADPRDVVRLRLLLQTAFHHVPTQQALRRHTEEGGWGRGQTVARVSAASVSSAGSHLEEDKATKTQNFPFHGAVEVSFPPEVHGGENVGQSDQPPPHAVAPLHVEDELKLWQSHVMVHSGETKFNSVPYLIFLIITKNEFQMVESTFENKGFTSWSVKPLTF